MDDDDVFTPDALAAIRGGIAEHPERVLLFRMDNYGTLLWRDRAIRYGNVGTPMVVVPNNPARLASWRFGDYEFIRDSCHRGARRPRRVTGDATVELPTGTGKTLTACSPASSFARARTLPSPTSPATSSCAVGVARIVASAAPSRTADVRGGRA
jgi:Rad3-related DNA helicase